MNKAFENFEYIGFDMDGTLFDTYEGIYNSLCYAMSKQGRPNPTEAQARLCIGPPLDDSCRALFGMNEQETTRTIELFRENYVPAGQNQCKPYDGIIRVLQELKKDGKKLFVATSKPVIPARNIVKRFELDQYFCHVEGTPPGAGDYSKEDVLKGAFAALGITDKSKVILIGDTKFDIIGAKAVGIQSMGVLYGFGSREELESHGADYIASTTDDILKFFR